MDQSTQQNAAMVEQTSAAARNLAAEVTSLSDEAARFKVGRSNAPAVRKPMVEEAPAAPRALTMAGDDWHTF